jgi:hypothetical protein
MPIEPRPRRRQKEKMSEAERDSLMMKLSLICMLLFFNALAAIALHPEWFGN